MSTSAQLMFTLSCLNLWMLLRLDLPHCTPVEQLDPPVSMRLDGEGYALRSRQHPLSFASPLP